jgi:O-antigen/teichoic acid export membrane protein
MLVIFALGGYGYLLSMVNIHSFLLSGLNATKNLVFIGWAEAILNLGISIALVGPLGIGGVALGTFLASLLAPFWMLPRDIYRQTEKRVKFHFWPIMRHAFFILIPCLIISVFIQHYWQNETSKIFINIIVIGIYLILSWRIMPIDIRNLVKNVLTGLRTRIKTASGLV